MKPKAAGTFQWNVSGWFRPLMGCSVWILFTGLQLVTRDTATAGAVLCVFGVTNAIAVKTTLLVLLTCTSDITQRVYQATTSSTSPCARSRTALRHAP